MGGPLASCFGRPLFVALVAPIPARLDALFNTSPSIAHRNDRIALGVTENVVVKLTEGHAMADQGADVGVESGRPNQPDQEDATTGAIGPHAGTQRIVADFRRRVQGLPRLSGVETTDKLSETSFVQDRQCARFGLLEQFLRGMFGTCSVGHPNILRRSPACKKSLAKKTSGQRTSRQRSSAGHARYLPRRAIGPPLYQRSLFVHTSTTSPTLAETKHMKRKPDGPETAGGETAARELRSRAPRLP
jgi:hypothetical protein